MKLAVNEIFGSTFQGEGKNLGMPCFFLRLSGCNQACVWCDTPYTWDWTGKNGKAYDPKVESHSMSTDEVLAVLEEKRGNTNVRNLVISGGEPLLQQKALMPLILALQAMGWWIEIETAGSVQPLPDFTPDQFTVSLKLENSGNPLSVRYNANAIDAFVRNERSVFKFVVSDIKDFAEIDGLVLKHLICEKCVYVMPEGITPERVQEHAQAVANETIRRGWNLTTRLQILLYGNQRGI